MTINCFFIDVSEHDIDLLFLEEFVCSEKFLNIFTEKAGIEKAKVISVYSSKTDIVLGESDITVIIESEVGRTGLLIENKIDAIAMPDQAKRYILRGEKGVEQGDYGQFFTFIIAPRKYLSHNKESKKYMYQIDYETVLSYFESIGDARSQFKIQQLKQAIEKQKKGYQVEEDSAVTEFWRNYSEYQKEYYPDVDFVYNYEIKGTNALWTRFNTVIDKLYMYHKTNRGYVDLTFDNCAGKIVEIENVLTEAVGDYLKEGYVVRKTMKSAAVRLIVPVVDVHLPFNTQIDSVDTGLKAVRKLSELVRLLNTKKIMDLLT